MENETKTNLEIKIEQARYSKKLVDVMDTYSKYVDYLNQTVPYAVLYEHKLVVKSTYKNEGEEKYEIVLDGDIIKVILEYYKNEKNNILEMIDKEVSLISKEGNIKEISSLDGVKVITSPISSDIDELKINVSVELDYDKAKQTVNELLESLKFRIQ